MPFGTGERSHHVFLSVQDSKFESYSIMKEQVRKAEEELKMQQKELEKSKKEVTFYSDVLLRSKFVFSCVFLHGCLLSARL